MEENGEVHRVWEVWQELPSQFAERVADDVAPIGPRPRSEDPGTNFEKRVAVAIVSQLLHSGAKLACWHREEGLDILGKRSRTRR